MCQSILITIYSTCYHYLWCFCSLLGFIWLYHLFFWHNWKCNIKIIIILLEIDWKYFQIDIQQVFYLINKFNLALITQMHGEFFSPSKKIVPTWNLDITSEGRKQLQCQKWILLQNLFWKVWHTFFPCINQQKVFLVKTVFLRAEILTKHLWSQGCYLCRLNSILNFGEFDDLDTDYWLFNCWLLIIQVLITLGWLLIIYCWLLLCNFNLSKFDTGIFSYKKGNLLVIYKKNICCSVWQYGMIVEFSNRGYKIRNVFA